MALSEYELRVLHEIENDLRASTPQRLRRLRTALVAHRFAILHAVLAIAVIVLLGLFALAPVAAAVGGAVGAAAGYRICASRQRSPR